MLKAGIIGAVLGLIYVMGLTLFSPFCTLCLTPLLGAAVGYLACHFDRPPTQPQALRSGLIAAGATGLVSLAGQGLAAVVNAVLVTNSPQLPAMLADFGLPAEILTDTQQYWQTTLATNTACGLVNLFIIIGLGAVGSMVWYNRHSAEMGIGD